VKGLNFFAVLHPPAKRQKTNKEKSAGFIYEPYTVSPCLCDKKEEGSGVTRRIRVVSMKRDPAAFIR